MLRSAGLVLGAIAAGTVAQGAALTIHLTGAATISRKSVAYQCDAMAAKIGLPTGSFNVEYINAGGNSIVLLPVAGNTLIFSNVSSASGARYTAQTYTWWEAVGAATMDAESLASKMQSICRRSPGK